MQYIKKLFTGGYDEIWKAIIRPPRDEYVERELGPEKFIIKDRSFRRNDYFIYNKNGEKL